MKVFSSKGSRVSIVARPQKALRWRTPAVGIEQNFEHREAGASRRGALLGSTLRSREQERLAVAREWTLLQHLLLHMSFPFRSEGRGMSMPPAGPDGSPTVRGGVRTITKNAN